MPWTSAWRRVRRMPDVDTASILARTARLRVPLGFVVGVVAIALARPSLTTLLVGVPIAVVGECVRVWAAGHLDKGREVTASGPYRWVRHPLYVGSSIIGVGFIVAAGTPLVALTVAIYLGLTITAAIKSEEAWLEERFGAVYERYRAGASPDTDRAFSLDRAMQNREYQAVVGLVIVVGLLWLRTTAV